MTVALDVIRDEARRAHAVEDEDPITPAASSGAPCAWRRAPDLVDVILERAGEPWVSLGLNGAEIARTRTGSLVVIMGSPGAGKSTLTAALLSEHARLHGPAIYLSIELDADELTARVVGMETDASWEDVLRGRVDRERMVAALPPRLIILERDGADPSQLDRVVAEVRAAHPGEPIVVAVDYIQLVDAFGREQRDRVAVVAEQLRAAAKRLGVLVIGVSQTSRAAGRALRTGELMGIETMTAGAESSAIERCAYVTMAIGSVGPEGDDGSAAVDLNLGKGRFGGGDRVVPMRTWGRSGLWRVAGAPRAAADVQAERGAGQAAGKHQAAMDALLAAAGRATSPVTREELRATASVGRTVAKAAIDALLATGSLVACGKAHRSANALLWTPDQVARRADADGRRWGDK